MGILSSQMINVYYDRFKDVEVTFTKELTQAAGLIAEQVHLKSGSDFWPCVFYSTSFQGAKIVANNKSDLLRKLQTNNNSMSLRLCFKIEDKEDPVTFFVTGRVVSTVPYKNSDDVSLLTVQYANRPPDFFIEVMGRILDANMNSSKNKDERIIITIESQRKMKLHSREITAFIQSVPRRCLLRELSFSSAKLIMMGVAKFLADKETALRLDFDDPRESFLLKGKFTSLQDVEGKKDMLVLSMKFDEAQIPTGYKVRINEYLIASRLDNRVPQNTQSGAE